MKKLPLGIQTFSEIIERDYLYIDKTADLYRLINEGKYLFLSRPRRFGKSLMISTLKELFQGNKKLFEGLHIYNKVEWQEHPVISIDFSLVDYNSVSELETSLFDILDEINEKQGLNIEKKRGLKHYFEKLLTALAEKAGRPVVILIDEYDKPIIDYINDEKRAKANRELLRSFYSVLKGADRYIRFVLLTGVSKFSKVSIFSGLNNLQDLTMESSYSTLLGITEDELKNYFNEAITKLAVQENLTEERLLGDIKIWYNGYSWDGDSRVYNPTSILTLFSRNRFGNYWFATGTPTFLLEMMEKHQYEITEIEGTRVGELILESYDIDRMDINALLLQTGYLTVKKVEKYGHDYLYVLGCPNREVKDTLLNYIVSSYTNTPVSKIKPLHLELKECLEKRDMERFINILKSLFASIPYNLHLPAEAYYHSLFYMILTLMGVKVNLEVLTDKGRMDGLIELEDKIYIIELKVGSPQEALEQIKERRYYEKYMNSGKELLLLGIGGFQAKEPGYLLEKVGAQA